ncbi:MAG: hypothetical protein IK137_00025 [Bacilli bacterium]|nr:hypothetical protein [Bacilli bacterium]
MNLIQMLDDEIRQLHLTDFEKARYIYLRCCEIFSFDSRFGYTNVFDDVDLYNKILNKKFDIENVTDELVICFSFSKYILKPLIDNLTNLNCSVVARGTHAYILLDYKCTEWKLDATLGDFSRVKLNLPTSGFKCKHPNLMCELDDIDLSLGFKKKSVDDYMNLITGISSTEKIISIGELLSNSIVKYHYADTWFLFDEVLCGYNYSNDNNTYLSKDYEFHRLIDTTDDYSFFDLSKRDGVCSIKRITRINYETLAKSLSKKKK